MKKIHIAALGLLAFVAVLQVGNLVCVDLLDSAKSLGGDLGFFTEESPFSASNETGVCLYKGMFPQRPPTCAGKTGDDLVTCCKARTKRDLNKADLIKYL